MKHTAIKKWFSVGLAALSLAGAAGAGTNDPFAAHKATVDRDIGLINTEKTFSVSDLTMEAARMIEQMQKSGNRSLLPYLAEKSLMTNAPVFIRARAATAYVKIADLDESVEFMQKLYAEDSDKTGHWRYMLNQQLLEKFDQTKQRSEVDVETANRFYQFLVAQVQTPAYPTQAEQIDAYLIRNLPGYETSKQRAVIGNAYASSTNEWRAKTFNPIKEHFDKIPPSKRVDLRARFPGLPPLPGDKNAGMPLKIALAVGAGLAAACAAIWFALKRGRTRNHADGQPDSLR